MQELEERASQTSRGSLGGSRQGSFRSVLDNDVSVGLNGASKDPVQTRSLGGSLAYMREGGELDKEEGGECVELLEQWGQIARWEQPDEKHFNRSVEGRRSQEGEYREATTCFIKSDPLEKPAAVSSNGYNTRSSPSTANGCANSSIVIAIVTNNTVNSATLSEFSTGQLSNSKPLKTLSPSKRSKRLEVKITPVHINSITESKQSEQRKPKQTPKSAKTRSPVIVSVVWADIGSNRE